LRNCYGTNKGERWNMAGSIDASDFIKPHTPEKKEVFEEQFKAPTPFDFIKSVSNSKKDLMKEDTENEKHYNAFIVNRGLGYFADTVLFANELNMYPDIPAKAQYYYYMSSIRKGNRFSKWHKLEKNPDQILIQKVYNVRPDIAKQYLKILSKNDISKLYELTDTGEKPKKINKK
jgi:hypothetical protein